MFRRAGGQSRLAKRLSFKEAQERHELPTGYTCRLSVDQYSAVRQFIDYDRRCCAMYTHTLEVTPAHCPIRVYVTTDNEGLKASLLAEIAALQAEAKDHLSST